jgi:hypothetical protein
MGGGEEMTDRRRAALAAILEFLVGGIVVLGGASLVKFALDAEGPILGIVHLALGLMAFPAGYLLLTGGTRARTFTLLVNMGIIGFSTLSEGLLASAGSLPTDDFDASLVGTTVAVLIGLAVIYLVRTNGRMFLQRGSIERVEKSADSPQVMEGRKA